MIEYIFSVEKMMCKNCEKHAVDAVKEVEPSVKVNASHTDKTVVITSKHKIDVEKVKSSIEERGYIVNGYTESLLKPKKLFGFIKK